jgi:hypothetical protein
VIIVTGHAPTKKAPTEAELGADEIAHYLKALGEAWTVLKVQEYYDKVRKDGEMPQNVIILEESAYNTETNAAYTAAFLRRVRAQIAKRRGVQAKAIPVFLAICTQKYHYNRLRIRESILPGRKSELHTWKERLPGVVVRHACAPYSPLRSEDPHTYWLARIYVSAHTYFDALMANLSGLARGEVDSLRPAAVERCMLGIMKLRSLLREKRRLAKGDRPNQVARVVQDVAMALPDLDDILRKILASATQKRTEESNWDDLAQGLGRVVNEEIRWPSDPDRR